MAHLSRAGFKPFSPIPCLSPSLPTMKVDVICPSLNPPVSVRIPSYHKAVILLVFFCLYTVRLLGLGVLTHSLLRLLQVANTMARMCKYLTELSGNIFRLYDLVWKGTTDSLSAKEYEQQAL